MNLCDMSQVRPLLARHGFHFSKSKGQNFLTQSWVPQRIAQEAQLDSDCGVLEIGPGIGALTQELCRSGAKVVAVEVDTSLRPLLAETVGEYKNLEIIFDDVLKLDLRRLVESRFAGLRPVACANLPYYITSPILSALLSSRLFDMITVMVQKEVAQRICAKAGTADYSAFSVFCQYYARPQLLFDVPPSCFLPQPKVTSAVLSLTMQEPCCQVANEGMLFRVVRAAFGQRRKTLLNALNAGFPQYSKEQLASSLLSVGIDPAVRGETLTLPQFAAIANGLYGREQG